MAAAGTSVPVPQFVLRPAVPRAMTRCECTGIAFAEIERQVSVEGRPLGEILGRTGCALSCGACLPDLEARLAAERLATADDAAR